jgi:hypothetical protein
VPPKFVRPCIPTTAKAIPQGDAWLHESKLDDCVQTFEDGAKLLEAAERHGLEGIVSKRQDDTLSLRAIQRLGEEQDCSVESDEPRSVEGYSTDPMTGEVSPTAGIFTPHLFCHLPALTRARTPCPAARSAPIAGSASLSRQPRPAPA